MTIRAVFFDFGGVILSSPFEAFAHHESERGLPEGFIRRLNSTNPDTNAWAQLERSEVDVDEFVALFEAEARAAGHELDGRAVLALLAGELRPEMAEAVRRCSQRLITALLTNNVVGMDNDSRFGDLLALFDPIVESSKVGVRKPDVRFYEMACELASVEPTEVVFLDDLGVNLKPARSLGMATIKVTDPSVALAELEAVVGFPLVD
ncbi:MAG: HAD-IA family hydrolase [Actinomycetota bacterium]|nr:HAD-IA family hydrolase [Actinomycetota bacterium]